MEGKLGIKGKKCGRGDLGSGNICTEDKGDAKRSTFCLPVLVDKKGQSG